MTVGITPGGAAVRPLPGASLVDVSVLEGRSGWTLARVQVRLTAPARKPVRVRWRTILGTAEESDFLTDRGTLVIARGKRTGAISILVRGDRNEEPEESLTVRIVSAQNARILRRNARVTVRNDDAPPVGATVVPSTPGTQTGTPAPLPAPALSGTNPISPAAEATPRLKGSAVAGTVVDVYATGNCTGSAIATGAAEELAGSGIAVAVTTDATSTLTARARDGSGRQSPCSSAITYTHRSTGPPAPVLSSTEPASPANNNQPLIRGTVIGAVSIELYAAAGCTGVSDAPRPASDLAVGIPMTVPSDRATAISARAIDAAGTRSTCSATLTYVEDSTDPPAPVLSTLPASPSPEGAPSLRGFAEAGTNVAIYRHASCGGQAESNVSAANLASPGVAVTVMADQSTTFTAQAMDAAGNSSVCSTPLVYVEDSTPPSAPTLTATNPVSPSNVNSPIVSGTTVAAGTAVRLYAGTCTGSPLATGTAAGNASFAIAVTLPSNVVSSIVGTATDAAGNTSGCSTSLSYTEDSATTTPTLVSTTPASPSSDETPVVHGTGAEAGAAVRIYAGTCTTALASGTALPNGSFDIEVTVPNDGTTQLVANAADAAGNTSSCSSALAYTEDSTAPAAPTLSATSPTSPSNDATPHVSGTGAEPGSTVRIYAGTCALALATVTANGDGTFASDVLVPNDTVTLLRATATDAAGNASSCSSGLSYTEDSTAPEAPALVATDPVSPSVSPAFLLLGTAEPGTIIAIYRTTNCTDAVVATAVAGITGIFSAAIDAASALTETFHFSARAIDGATNGSTCSASIAYEHLVP